ncbi:hypothetical protein CR513_37018, partial [Mucuna pruriens]
MGDLLGSPRVATLFWVDLHVYFNTDASIVSFSTERHGGIHIVINRATLDRSVHTITNAPDPIRTP